MTTLEKLFVQIFERKDRIIEQIQQQADAYTQQLASRLLIDGITPPPWLLSPSSSDPNALGKDEIISKLLLRPPRDSIAYSVGGRSLYRIPVVTGGNGWLSNEKCMETHASNKGLNVSNGQTTTLEYRDNDVGCSLNCVAEQDDSVNSPQNETDARISDIYAEPDNSLARIQRSKPRQKARELRSNVKGAAKICLSHENRTRVSFSGNSISKTDFHQLTQDQDKYPSDLAKCKDTSGDNSVAAERKGHKGNDRTSHSSKLTRSSCSYEKPGFLNDHSKTVVSSEKEELDCGTQVQPTGKLLQQSGHVNGVKDAASLPDVSLGSYAAEESITRKTQGTQRESKVYCGRTTRSRSSSQQTSGTNTSSNPGPSSCNEEEGKAAIIHPVGNFMHQLDASSKLLDGVQTSSELGDRIGETQAICSNEDSLKPVISSNIAARQVTRSRSGSMKEPPLVKSLVDSEGYATQNTLASQPIPYLPTGANHEENAKTFAGNGPIDAPVANRPVNCGINYDPITLWMESEGLASRQSSHCCMVVKPKQLDFDEMDECDLNEFCSPLSKKRKLHGLSGQECAPSKESAASIDHKPSSSFFEPQLPLGSVLSSKPKAARTHLHDSIGERAKDETMNNEPEMNENLVENVEHISKVTLHDNIDVPCEVIISPKGVQNSSHEEQQPGKFSFNEDYVSSSKMQIKEGDLGNKGEESTTAIYIPEYKDTESLFIPSLTKQGNKDSQDCLGKEVRTQEQDLGSSKSKELEVGRDLKFSNVKLNSARVNTWPCNQTRKVEDQPNSVSASRGFRVPSYLDIQRDPIECDLASENDLHSILKSASVLSSEERDVSQSNGIQNGDKGVDHRMMHDLAEGTGPLHKLQAEEVIVSQVDGDTAETPYTLKQSGPTCALNLIVNATDDSTYGSVVDVGPAIPAGSDEVAVSTAVTDGMNFERSLPQRVSHLGKDGLFLDGSVQSPRSDAKTIVGSDEIMPVFESFVIDEQAEYARMDNAGGGIDFDTLEMPSTTIERASILEQICKSVSKQTPFSQFSSSFKQHQIQDLYGSEANGFLEHMGLRSTVPLDEDSNKHIEESYSHISAVDYAFPKHQNFDSFPFSATPFYLQSKNHYSSPVGKWERSTSSSGSSDRQFSSNPELTCFPIEEDPSSNEESYNAEEVSDEPTDPPAEPTEPRRENVEEVADEIHAGIVSRVANDPAEREPPVESTEVCSHHENPMSTWMKYSDRCSSNSVSFSGTHNKVKHKPKVHPSLKVSRYGVENRTSSYLTRASSRGNVSLLSEYSKNQSNMKKGIARLSQKEAKRNNIVSNITSFIPIVQQKQAAAVCTGKRDIKVKALEAAEAAKRREEEKENERKMKKEALKIERARIEKQNAKEMELNKKKKQEEHKKKEADMAARKRQREEDERKQMAKKRKLVAEARKEQKLQYEKKIQYDKSRAGKAEKEKQHAKNAETAGNRKGSDDATENLRQNRSADENSLQNRDTELRTDRTLASDIKRVTSVLENRDASNDCGDNEKATSIFEKSPIKVESVKSTIEENSYDISPYQCSDDEDEEEDDIPMKKFVPSWASKNNVAMLLPLQQNLDPEKIFSMESFCSMDEVLLPRRLQPQ